MVAKKDNFRIKGPVTVSEVTESLTDTAKITMRV